MRTHYFIAGYTSCITAKKIASIKIWTFYINNQTFYIKVMHVKERKFAFDYRGVTIWTCDCAKPQSTWHSPYHFTRQLNERYLWRVLPLAIVFAVKTVQRNKSGIATAMSRERAHKGVFSSRFDLIPQFPSESHVISLRKSL